MKLLLKLGAIASHPVFLPLFSLIVYLPLVTKYGSEAMVLSLVWVGFVYLFLPLLFFTFIRKINLQEPTLENRRTIFRAYTLINFGFALVSLFIMKEYISFFIAAAVLHMILLFMAHLELKASWHTSVWAFLFSAYIMVLYNYHFVGWTSRVSILLGVLALVVFIRWQAQAHTRFELLMGIAAGLFSALPILFF